MLTVAYQQSCQKISLEGRQTRDLIDIVIDWDEAKVIGKESDRYKRWIKEAIAIRKQGTTINRDEGQYQLSHVFDDLLKKSSGNFVAKQQSRSAVHRRSSLIH